MTVFIRLIGLNVAPSSVYISVAFSMSESKKQEADYELEAIISTRDVTAYYENRHEEYEKKLSHSMEIN